MIIIIPIIEMITLHNIIWIISIIANHNKNPQNIGLRLYYFSVFLQFILGTKQ